MLLAISPNNAPILHDDLPLRVQAEIIFCSRKRRKGEPRLRLINPAEVSRRLLLCGGRDAGTKFGRLAGISGHSLTPSDKCVGDIALIGSRSFIGSDHLSEEPVLRLGGLDL